MRTPSPNSFVSMPRIRWCRRKWDGVVLGIATIGLLILLIVLLPMIIPVVALLDFIYRKRLKAAACTFACLSCGGILGLESIRLADETWAKRLRELQEKSPGIRFRLVRHLHAICPACGACYAFLKGERTFRRLRADRVDLSAIGKVTV